jgi:hypothetical protein
MLPPASHAVTGQHARLIENQNACGPDPPYVSICACLPQAIEGETI